MGFQLQSHRLVTKYPPPPGTVKPDATNTGPRIGLSTYTGDYTLTSGQSISGLHISGDLYLGGPNVSATDCQIDGSVMFNTAPGGNYGNPNPWTNQTISYCRMAHIDATGCDTITIDHCHLDGSLGYYPQAQIALISGGVGVPPVANVTMTSSLVDHAPTWDGVNPADPHMESLHLTACQTALIQNNVFNWDAGPTHVSACVNIDNGSPANNNITFDGNWVYGGGNFQITLFLAGTSYVTNNKFSTPPSVTQYSDANSSSFHFTQSGNTLDGSPYTLPYS